MKNRIKGFPFFESRWGRRSLLLFTYTQTHQFKTVEIERVFEARVAADYFGPVEGLALAIELTNIADAAIF